jgi:hypothetical protein
MHKAELGRDRVQVSLERLEALCASVYGRYS